MQRTRQNLTELLGLVSRVATGWRDPLADRVLSLLETFPLADEWTEGIKPVLQKDFDAGITIIRMILGLSKDEFTHELRAVGNLPLSKSSFARDPEAFISLLTDLGVPGRLEELRSRQYTWKDIIVERLRSGRGSAIKGQARGRALEDFTEELVLSCFGAGNYDVRCRFLGAAGTSTEKADFAIPNRNDPCVLIEVKAYGATGSKQTDILGDIARIAAEKRSDTTLLLVTDGISWHARKSDLQKLIEMQNQGMIARIYTQAMRDALWVDLEQMKQEYHL